MMHYRASLSGAALLAFALTATLPSLPARAQGTPSDSVLRGFKPNGEYALLVGGKEDKGAQIYRSDSVPAYLIISSALPSPVLLTPRDGMKTQTVSLMKIAKQPDGSVDLLADAALKPQGIFQVTGERVTFTSEGRPASLVPKPPLVGLKKAAELKAHSPEYVSGASAYKPNPQMLAALRKQPQPVRVRVVFGSWCPHCKELLPHLLRIEDEIKGSKIQFEYFGLPRPPAAWQDPEALRLKVRGVPTAVIYNSSGKEIGRLVDNDWTSPESALNRVLSSGGKAGR
jgi:thiol-disulfide isomerase/thioredoxin